MFQLFLEVYLPSIGISTFMQKAASVVVKIKSVLSAIITIYVVLFTHYLIHCPYFSLP